MAQSAGTSVNLRDQAYDAFTKQLVDRKLHAGEFVTQRGLAELTGFPITAIREMIPRLEAEGLLRAIAQRGLQVANVDPRLIHDAYRLREIIEVDAIAHYVRTAPDAMVRRQRTELGRINEMARKGGSANLLAEAQAVDWGFHNEIVAHLGNRLIDDVHRVNAIRIRMIMHDRVSLSPVSLPPALDEHDEIIAAIEARDETSAVRALRNHLGKARARALGYEGGWQEASREEDRAGSSTR